MMAHAKLSPSSAHRWIRCPGSVKACQDIPNLSSSYADEGSYAHAIAAADLTNTPRPGPIERESHDYIKVYTEAIQRAAEGKMLLVEQSLDIGAITTEEGARGTSDAIIVDFDSKTIEVHDLKFGQGHLVNADENDQLKIYGLAALIFVEDLFGGEFETIKLVIHQPRRDHLSEWTIDRERLLSYGSVVNTIGERILTDDLATLNPSDKACLWCPAKATCPALAAHVQSEVFDDFGTVEPPKTKALTDALPTPSLLGMIKEWVAAVEAKIEEKLKNRQPVEGWKLVLGRQGNRAWLEDTTTLEEKLKSMHIKKSDSHVEQLKSVAQMEKSISKKKFEKLSDFIIRADARPVVVPATDPKPEYQVAAADEFDIFT